MLEQYLYLLVAEDNASFKIGVSKTPETRMRSVAGSFDYGQSWQIQCRDGTAYRIEKTLHFLFRQHRIEVERSDGYTEWFAMDCFNKVLQFLHDHHQDLDWLSAAPIIASNVACEQDLAAQARARTERLLLKEARCAKKRSDCLQMNAITAQHLERWLTETRKAKKLLGTITTVMGQERQVHIVSHSLAGFDPSEMSYLFPISYLEGDRVRQENVIANYQISDWQTDLVFSTIAYGWPRPVESCQVKASSDCDITADPSIQRISVSLSQIPSLKRNKRVIFEVFKGLIHERWPGVPLLLK